MIKNITTALKNLGSKFLIIIIALSFALWGIGDIFINNSNNPTIAKVGSSEIKLNEFQLDYQLLIDSLRQNNQQPVTEELLKALLVAKESEVFKATAQNANDLHIIISVLQITNT